MHVRGVGQIGQASLRSSNFSCECRCSHVGGGLVAAASSNIEIGGKRSPSATVFVLEHGVHFCQGLQGCRSLWLKPFGSSWFKIPVLDFHKGGQ